MDYLNVAIKDGCLSLTMGLANGKQEMQIKPNKVRFDDNQWHKVSVHRRIQEVCTTLQRQRTSLHSFSFKININYILRTPLLRLACFRLYVGRSEKMHGKNQQERQQ